jgi:tRNA A-37 threonylcarbamoyl transferase component Bud32
MSAPAPAPAAAPAHRIRCLKADGRRSVWLVRRPDGPLRTVKTWPCTLAARGKLLLGIAQVQRQVRGQRRLAAAGVSSPAPVGPWRIVRGEQGSVIELELEFVDGRPVLDLLEPPAAETAATHAAAGLGRLVARLARARLFNRDIKLSNVIVVDPDATEPALWIIDPVGVRPMRRVTEETERMIERLAVEPVRHGWTIPRGAAVVALLNALRGTSRDRRRAVLRRLRARRRR